MLIRLKRYAEKEMLSNRSKAIIVIVFLRKHKEKEKSKPAIAHFDSSKHVRSIRDK